MNGHACDRRPARSCPPVPAAGLAAYPRPHIPLNALAQWWGTDRHTLVLWIRAGYLPVEPSPTREWRINREVAATLEPWLWSLGPFHPIYTLKRRWRPQSGAPTPTPTAESPRH
jgi:hypothetical protein